MKDILFDIARIVLMIIVLFVIVVGAITFAALAVLTAYRITYLLVF